MLGHRLGTTAIAATVTALAVLPLTACGDDDGPRGAGTSDPPATEGATTTGPDPDQQAEADVEAAYLAYWEMSERLAASPDPEDPEITERTTGGARQATISLLNRFLADERVVNFLANYGHEVLSVDVSGTTARVRDCYIDHAAEVDRRSGRVIDEATATIHLDVTLTQEAGLWKVSQLSRLDAWEGVVECE